MNIQIKWIYEAVSPADGKRILVDRLLAQRRQQGAGAAGLVAQGADAVGCAAPVVS